MPWAALHLRPHVHTARAHIDFSRCVEEALGLPNYSLCASCPRLLPQDDAEVMKSLLQLPGLQGAAALYGFATARDALVDEAAGTLAAMFEVCVCVCVCVCRSHILTLRLSLRSRCLLASLPVK